MELNHTTYTAYPMGKEMSKPFRQQTKFPPVRVMIYPFFPFVIGNIQFHQIIRLSRTIFFCFFAEEQLK